MLTMLGKGNDLSVAETDIAAGKEFNKCDDTGNTDMVLATTINWWWWDIQYDYGLNI